MHPEVDPIMDPEVDPKMDSEVLEEASPTESMPSSTDEWDRGTTYEYSPKKSKFPKRPLPRPTTFLILGRILTASALPRFMHMWTNTFFPYPSLIPHTLTSLTTHVGTVDAKIASITSLLSAQPLSTGVQQGWPQFVHLNLHRRLISGSAFIQDFQDLINGCEKMIYSIKGGVQVLPQGTYVEMQTENIQSIGCRIGKRLLRMLAGRQRTRRLDADLTNWIVDTEKWVDLGMKEVRKEEARVATEGWIYESDESFWQDDLYRPKE